MRGKSLSNDYDAGLLFMENIRKIIQENHEAHHRIYNAAASFFWRVLPMICAEEKFARGRKIIKQRITYMSCCNTSAN